MNLKEYNYCKRHHPKALSRLLNIRINNFFITYENYRFHGEFSSLEQEKIDSVSSYDNVNKNITLFYLI